MDKIPNDKKEVLTKYQHIIHVIQAQCYTVLAPIFTPPILPDTKTKTLTKTKTMTKTTTETKAETKCLKYPAYAIFLKS